MRDGTWLHEGSPIGRMELVRLFSTVLQREDDGFVLKTPVEVAEVLVDDSPFVVVEMKKDQAGVIQFRTNIDDWIVWDKNHPLNMKGGVPYLFIREGIEARINTSVYYELADMGVLDNAE